MNRNEIRHLLSMAMAFDNRQPGEAQVMAWLEVANRERWTFEAARDALTAHFAESTDYLMPGHITQRIKQGRSQPPAPAETRAELERKPAEPQHVRTVMTELGRRMGWHHEESESDEFRRALAVQCPHCHAVPGVACARQVTRGHRRGQFARLKTAHPSRVELAGE